MLKRLMATLIAITSSIAVVVNIPMSMKMRLIMLIYADAGGDSWRQ